jgi:cation transport ATPase
LLAERSRRITDELHDSRPRWLRSLSRGINLILLALVVPLVGPILGKSVHNFIYFLPNGFLDLIGFDLAAVLLALGVFLLTRPEGYAPADRADRGLRIRLRVLAIVPALAAYIWNLYGVELWPWDSLFLVIVALLPLHLFIHLRGLARRARSAHLAEHCMIVAIGTFASLLYVAAVNAIVNSPGNVSYYRGLVLWPKTTMLMMLVLGVASGLFLLWSIYLLMSFADAFWTAARTQRRKWSRDDRSVTR